MSWLPLKVPVHCNLQQIFNAQLALAMGVSAPTMISSVIKETCFLGQIGDHAASQASLAPLHVLHCIW